MREFRKRLREAQRADRFAFFNSANNHKTEPISLYTLEQMGNAKKSGTSKFPKGILHK